MFNLENNQKNKLNLSKSLLNQINFLEESVKFLTDDELKSQTLNLINKYLKKQNFSEDIIINSFALTREASKRSIGLRHYDEQLFGGLVLHNGKIAEMKTGEGKTLVATLPATLNAITKKGVHIVTVNDYLAKRDSSWMGQVFKTLGLTVGLVQSNMNNLQKKNSYFSDITYITNSELGFDFLRDNMVSHINQLVQRPFNYCIIDEIDSILIDESRTPLVLSGSIPINSNIYIQASEISKNLRKSIDYTIDEKTRNIIITEIGSTQIEKILGIPNIFEAQKPWLFHITNALKANNFYLKDVQYILRNNQICIIDEFTGRIMPERRWDNGLHEAIEAKENIFVKISSESVASITYQNFFTLYPKLSGMTGTAKTAEREFEKIYNLEVIVVPTHRDFKRKDLEDRVYKDEIFKWKAVAKECVSLYKIGRPILIGTNTIEKSEIVSLLLKDCNIPHKLLNAKPENLKFESEIIAEAGCKKAVTIATNMAGRGTDIILGGTLNYKPKRIIKFLILKKEFLNSTIKNFLIKKIIKSLKKNEINFEYWEPIIFLCQTDFKELKSLKTIKSFKNKNFKTIFEILYFYIKINYISKTNDDIEEICNLGGLFVIGTERHESRRIDNQLRGRAGRQGDPGSSRFFISLEDKIFRLYGGNKIKNLADTLQINDTDSPLESKFLTKSLDLAQQRVENYYYEIRKNLFNYDEVLNEQRKVFYKTRAFILETLTIKNWVLDIGEYFILNLISYLKKPDLMKKEQEFENELIELKNILGFSFKFNFHQIPFLILFNFLREQFWLTYEVREIVFESIYPGEYNNFERSCLLQAIDVCWSQHLEKISELRESIGWQAYAQKDPLIVYKEEAYNLFSDTSNEIRNIFILNLFLTDIT